MSGALVASLFSITEKFLTRLNTKEARKYKDRVIFLNKEYYAEENKDEDTEQDHAYMDNILNELCIISKAASNFSES